MADKLQMTNRWLVMGTVMTGTFMVVLDSSIVTVSLPTIASSLGADLGALQWVPLAYLLVITSLLLSFGRLADLVGRKWVFIVGFGIFTVGALLSGLAGSVGQLIAFRALQGLGAGMIMAVGPALTVAAFRPEERGKALGLNALTVGVSATIGPTIGGLIVDLIDWRAVFYLRVPIGLIGIVLAHRFLVQPERRPSDERFDLGGAVALAASLVCLILGLTGTTSNRALAPFVPVLLVGAVAGLVGFFVWERRTRYPLVDLGLLGNRVFALSSLSSMMSFLSTSSVIFLIPFYLEGVLHYQPREVGTVLIAQPLAIALTAPFSGVLSDRFGYRWLNLAGLIAICSSLALMSTLTVESTQLGVMTRLGLMGFGQGIFQSPNNNAIMGAAPKERLGLASAMMATMRNLGFSLGIAVGGTLFPLRLAAHGADLVGTPLEIGARNPQLFVDAMQETFLIAAALASIGLLSSIVRGGAPRDVRPMSAAPADIRR